MLRLETKTKHNHTTYFDLDEDGLHVASIIELERATKKKPGLYQWTTAGRGDYADTRDEADAAIRRELER